ncbi:MAG TPA: TolC family protein [Candidatus Binataceae bacterium]|nr:TolC family protein [Candidatus Binataceae bacterium]
MLQRLPGVLLAAALFWTTVARAQTPGDQLQQPLTLKEAVNYALAHHPRLRTQIGLEEAAAAKLGIARSEYIPTGYVGLQENRATGNVVPGAHFNMEGIPPIAGPPRDRVFDSGMWGSTAGLSLSYDIAHLTQKMALVDASLADRRSAQAGVDAEALSVAFGAADAFAAAVQADRQLAAAHAALKRAQVFQNTVDALVRSGLRPGADAARAAAETAAAERNLIKSEEQKGLSEEQLAEALGAAGEPVQIVPGRLATRLPPEEASAVSISVHNPSIVSAEQSVHAARDREHAAILEYIPRIEIAAALFGRANGLFTGGANLGFAQGVVPDTPNWAAGVVITIPILEYPAIRAQADLAKAEKKIASAHRSEIVQQIQTQVDSARTILKAAFRTAKETQIELDSSHAAVEQAEARYRAGLYGVDPVAESLRLLAQAEADDAVARVEVWRAKLLLARAVGDMGPLLKSIDEATRENR